MSLLGARGLGLGAISNGFNLCGWKFTPLGPQVSIGAKSMTNELEECRVGRKWILWGKWYQSDFVRRSHAEKSRGLLCCRREFVRAQLIQFINYLIRKCFYLFQISINEKSHCRSYIRKIIRVLNEECF